MITLHYPNLHPNDVLDRFFNSIYKLYPSVFGIDLHGDDAKHNLDFFDSETCSKTIQFLKHVYFNNKELRFNLKFSDDSTSLVESSYDNQNNHQFSLVHTDLNFIFSVLHPLWASSENGYYISTAFGLVNNFEPQNSKPNITESTLLNYQFIEESFLYIQKINFQVNSEHTYSYSFDTFLPENISREEFLRLLLFVLGRKYESLNKLKSLKFNDKIDIVTERIKKDKEIDFSSVNPVFTGTLNPISKAITLKLG